MNQHNPDAPPGDRNFPARPGSFKIDISSGTVTLHVLPMISNPSTSSLYQPFAMSAGLHGMVCELTVTTRPWLAESHKGTAARQDGIVIG